jgi:hypothetical protein
MAQRLRLSLHVALTLVAFATTGRAPRVLPVGPRDLAVHEERLATVRDDTSV